MRPPQHPDAEDGSADHVLLNQRLPASDLERWDDLRSRLSGTDLARPHHLCYNKLIGAARGMGIHPVLRVVFFRSQEGGEPVRDWLLDLSRGDRKPIGCDIKTAQYGWPLECL